MVIYTFARMTEWNPEIIVADVERARLDKTQELRCNVKLQIITATLSEFQ